MAHRYRLYPTGGQEPILARHCADARLVWNAALEQFNHWRAGHPASPGPAERVRQLAEARQEYEWLAEGSSSVQQQALRDFAQAVANFFARTHGRPRWRKRGRGEGFCVRDVAVRSLNGRWGELTIPKTGRVRFRVSRPLPPGRLGMARVTLDGKHRWHVSFPGPQPALERQATGAIVGVDRGVAATLAYSDGRMLRAPMARERERRRLGRLQRRLARQRKGSRRRERTKRQIAGLHQKVADRRRNWIEVQTTRLVRECDLIAVEDLKVANMVRRPAARPDPERAGTFAANGAKAKTGLNRSILAQGWSRWLRRLHEKAEASGVQLVKVHPAHTSDRCRVCRHQAAENRESQAVFRCVNCGHSGHADLEAADNILARALGLAPTPGHGGKEADRLPARVSRRSWRGGNSREEVADAA